MDSRLMHRNVQTSGTAPNGTRLIVLLISVCSYLAISSYLMA